jgi:predicted nucleic acid-binding protein
VTIVVDTGGLLALLDADDRHHAAVRELFDSDGGQWVLPWAILPEIDYLASTRLGARVAQAFVEDLNAGVFRIDANFSKDLPRAVALLSRYKSLELGLVDAVVMAQAERHEAEAILTLDRRHFRAVKLAGAPRLLPEGG